MSGAIQPILVMPVFRGGAKFERALKSVRNVEPYFHRIVISLNGPIDSPDLQAIAEYHSRGASKIETIQTGLELPWMQHQYFWLNYLESTGESSAAWVMWFAHDDQLRQSGIAELTSESGGWPLRHSTVYLGPWGMRYDPIDGLYQGLDSAPLESWTSFPLEGPLRMPVSEWVSQQLIQPTYINMSGCVTQIASFQSLRNFPLRKPGGMRIEMATAASPNNKWVEEFPETLVVTHTSKRSDRTTYAKVARKDDAHMVAWFSRYLVQHPSGIPSALRATWRIGTHHLKKALGRSQPVVEDWRHRSTIEP